MTPDEEPLSIKMIADYAKRQLKDFAKFNREVQELRGFQPGSQEYRAVMIGQMLRDPDLPLAYRQELLRRVGQSSYSD